MKILNTCPTTISRTKERTGKINHHETKQKIKTTTEKRLSNSYILITLTGKAKVITYAYVQSFKTNPVSVLTCHNYQPFSKNILQSPPHQTDAPQKIIDIPNHIYNPLQIILVYIHIGGYKFNSPISSKT